MTATVRRAYTFGVDNQMPFRGDSYVILETETEEQQRPFAATIFGNTDPGNPNSGIRFAFDYDADEFENGTKAKQSQVEKWHYRKAAEFSTLAPNPTKEIPSKQDLLDMYVEGVLASVRTVTDNPDVLRIVENNARDDVLSTAVDSNGLLAIWLEGQR